MSSVILTSASNRKTQSQTLKSNSTVPTSTKATTTSNSKTSTNLEIGPAYSVSISSKATTTTAKTIGTTQPQNQSVSLAEYLKSRQVSARGPVVIGSMDLGSGAIINLAGGARLNIAPGAKLSLAAGATLNLAAGTTLDIEAGKQIAIGANSQVTLTGKSDIMAQNGNIAIGANSKVTLSGSTRIETQSRGNINIGSGSNVTLSGNTDIATRYYGTGNITIGDGSKDVLSGEANLETWGAASINIGTSSNAILSDKAHIVTYGYATGNINIENGSNAVLSNNSYMATYYRGSINVMPGSNAILLGNSYISSEDDSSVTVRNNTVLNGSAGYTSEVLSSTYSQNPGCAKTLSSALSKNGISNSGGSDLYLTGWSEPNPYHDCGFDDFGSGFGCFGSGFGSSYYALNSFGSSGLGYSGFVSSFGLNDFESTGIGYSAYALNSLGFADSESSGSGIGGYSSYNSDNPYAMLYFANGLSPVNGGLQRVSYTSDGVDEVVVTASRISISDEDAIYTIGNTGQVWTNLLRNPYYILNNPSDFSNVPPEQLNTIGKFTVGALTTPLLSVIDFAYGTGAVIATGAVASTGIDRAFDGPFNSSYDLAKDFGANLATSGLGAKFKGVSGILYNLATGAYNPVSATWDAIKGATNSQSANSNLQITLDGSSYTGGIGTPNFDSTLNFNTGPAAPNTILDISSYTGN